MREGRASGGTELDTLLQPRVTAAAQAMVLPTQRLLLPKGAFIDCTLETAIDSTLPGMTTCITATDTFGADGSTVLLERGTKLVGETRGQVQQGAARVFVLWNEARTPTRCGRFRWPRRARTSSGAPGWPAASTGTSSSGSVRRS